MRRTGDICLVVVFGDEYLVSMKKPPQKPRLNRFQCFRLKTGFWLHTIVNTCEVTPLHGGTSEKCGPYLGPGTSCQCGKAR